jgi:hypothetical protein
MAKASLEDISVFYVVAMFYLWQTIFLGKPGALGGFTWSR